jgi:phosphoglycerate dehydrogenase-like enzyme
VPFKLAILDDYQGVADTIVDWSALPDVEVTAFTDHLSDEVALVDRLAPFDGIMAMRERTAFTRRVLEHLPALRLLVTTGPFNAAIDVQAARDQGVVVSGTGGAPWPTAELTWALILAVARHVPAEDRSVRAGGWQHTIGADLYDRTLGVVGLGNLGTKVAEVGRAFGMHILAWSQNLTPERARGSGAELVTKDELFARSDVVTVHLVLSDRTRGLIGERELKAMRGSAYLINTSRGPIVDEHALVQALQEGWIAGAGLDVFDEEPLPADHPLRRAPRTVLTPHIGYVTQDTYRVFFDHALEDVQAFLAGAPIRVIEAGRE